jgi:hypothetical protein
LVPSISCQPAQKDEGLRTWFKELDTYISEGEVSVLLPDNVAELTI